MNAQEFFTYQHDVVCNQKYADTLPYSFHLDCVAKQHRKFVHLIGGISNFFISTAIWGHDSLEDARLTYNNIKDEYGVEVAEIIYLCTENRGRTRGDRKDDSWYEELKANKDAVFVKLCDIIANVKFSLLTNSKMYRTYKAEYTAKVKPHLYCEEYKEMFDYLEALFNVES